jgi:hypothetical protein
MSRTTTTVKDLKDNYSMPHNESGGNCAFCISEMLTARLPQPD